MFKRKLLGLAAAGMLAGFALPSQASYLSSILTSGVQNDFSDQSREVFFDNGDGVFGEGDILTGFIRLDDKVAPNAIDLDNKVYAIFSQQVVNVSGSVLTFGAVDTAAHPELSLSGLGIAGANDGDMIAVFSSHAGFSTDLITTSPGDRTGNGTVTMADYFDVIISEGALDVLAGVYDTPACTGGDTDCFQARSDLTGAPTSSFIDLASNVTIANYVGGLETTLDPAGYELQDGVTAGFYYNPIVVSTAELAISNGAVRGYSGVVNASEWINGSELSSMNQCTDAQGNNTPCGFIDDADFGVLPIPEPSSLALLGLGLLGMGAAGRRRKS